MSPVAAAKRGKGARSIRLIEACIEILREIQPATVRAVCYQLFGLRLIQDMSKNSTNAVSRQLVHAREAGSIPWAWIVDEMREAERPGAYMDLAAYGAVVEKAYRRDRWNDQPERVEVWSEKGTVRGTLGPVLNEFGITFRVMHGYGSATTIKEIADEQAAVDRPFIALYVGDWDPSGLHMSGVDLPERLRRYGASELLDLRRVALTEDDVRHGRLPHFEAGSKKSDPRYRWFVERYGQRCWELDAMRPPELRKRVREQIEALIEPAAWERAEAVELAEREALARVVRGMRDAGLAT